MESSTPAVPPNGRLLDWPTDRFGKSDWSSCREASTEQKLFAGALQERGYALVKASMPYADEMRIAGSRRFALSQATKYSLEGYRLSHNKEHFSFRPDVAARRKSEGTHIRNTVQAYTDSAISKAEDLMKAINKCLLYPNVRVRTEAVNAWFGGSPNSDFSGHCNLSSSVMHDRFYHEAPEGELRAAPHVDRGLLTIISNPFEVEVRVGDEWVRPYSRCLPPLPRASCAPCAHSEFGEQNVVLVLVGYSLEKATNGLLRAALHRVVSQGGTRRSSVLDVRAPSSLQVCPAELSPPPPVGEELDKYELAAQAPFVFSELIAQFDATHVSINAPAAAVDPLPTLEVASPTYYNLLLSLPPDLLMQLLVEIDTPATMAWLASTCTFLRCLTSREEVWVPLAERCHIDWNLALDRIDTGATSIGRTRVNVPVQQPAALLQAMQASWSRVIGTELNPKTHLNAYIDATVVTQDGNEIFYKFKFSTPLGKVMTSFCQRQGVALASVRFVFDGTRINDNQTALDLSFENSEVIDVMVEQQGD